MLEAAASSSPLLLVVGIFVGYFVRSPSGSSEPPEPAEECQNTTEVRELKRPFLVQVVERKGFEAELMIGILVLIIVLLILSRRRDAVPARQELRAKVLLVK